MERCVENEKEVKILESAKKDCTSYDRYMFNLGHN